MKNQIYNFSDSKCLVVCGDIHGDFNQLVHKVCVQYQMRDTVIVVAGDCGFGFERKGYYENMVKRNSKRMKESNNRIVFVRGNHDNPAYFDGNTFCHQRFVAVPDYSVIRVGGHAALCVGGAISIDRNYRIAAWSNACLLNKKPVAQNDALAPNYYWSNEYPVFNPQLLDQVLSENTIDVVITHSAPSFCELKSKLELNGWIVDDDLYQDIKNERAVMDKLYERLKGTSVTHWCYGHFHQSWHSSIDGILFKMLDIMELFEVRQ